MESYLNYLRDIRDTGEEKSDRTKTGTVSKFGLQIRHDLRKGFPLLTTKKVHWKSIIVELLWFLRGETNVRSLQEEGVSIWNEWADANGELGPVYGHQWRFWKAADGRIIDQIAIAIEQLRKDPDSRRIIVSAWNPGDLDKMALAPCHAFFQLYASQGKLSLQIYQRSADSFLGVPFNIASYAALLMMFAQQTNLEARELVWTGGDCHIYSNHREQVNEQLSRAPRALPKLILKRKPEDIFSYKTEDFELEGYDPLPGIKAPIAV